jgi:hypothetical protein
MVPANDALGLLGRVRTSSLDMSHAMIGAIVGLIVLLVVASIRESRRRRERMEALMTGVEALTAEEFLRYTVPSAGEVTGVYVLHNVTSDRYYVGQSKCVLARVRHHLTGSGNGDVYADYRRGDAFEVSVISCARSGYTSINALERDLIAHYDAYTRGYNKTAGNAG